MANLNATNNTKEKVSIMETSSCTDYRPSDYSKLSYVNYFLSGITADNVCTVAHLNMLSSLSEMLYCNVINMDDEYQRYKSLQLNETTINYHGLNLSLEVSEEELLEIERYEN
ncbi:hypothetical protein EIN_133410 [Entamoeba invadens IP1]|uniref:Uncharacterized protein n=1 Tax=Entamoeba invadens IP1 TaxID=370355 RepID=L7FMN2_ENTIV|nr:hypothetical protein EIN_133410 [Entamoeba invadens IP1]ELP86662.1 hypothetical protein EIN_133410 [Entamoeba invadens IP1]|eukprot:XP_004186008.1 hypothetical protein EIN_133410 [Entamoeba invadens IP1]